MIKLWNLALKMFKTDDNEVINNGSSRTNETVVNLSKNNKPRNSMYMSNIRVIRKSTFLIPNFKKTFNYLRLVFTKA